MLEHYRQIEQSTGVRPPELNVPDVPAALAHFWQSFLRVHQARTADDPVAFSEVDAYSRLTGHDFTPDEIDLISELDGVWREERRKWRR